MRYKISPPDAIHTTVQLPASKSMSNRALILNALSLSTYNIRNLSDCEDTRVIIDAFNSDSNVFDVKGAGTAMRFLTAFLAGMEGEWIIKGSKRMHERPIHPLVETLTALGAEIEYLEKEGFPPLRIKGRKLKGGEVYLSGNISSQFISALLMVAPLMENGLIMHIEKKIVSKPYIDLTMAMMAQCGVVVKWAGNDILIKPQQYQAIELAVETDWSAASYWYELVALTPGAQVTLLGLHKKSLQGDANVANLFSDLGVTTEFVEEGAVIRHTKRKARKFFHDFVNEPDLAQTFAATCCFMGVPFLFSGIQSLKIKETDRVQALINELKKLGFILKETEIGMLEWDGERCTPVKEPAIDTYDDHRMAMSFAPGAMVFRTLNINNPEVVTKSYPNFWDDLKRAGFNIEER
ncbi:MAG: 3-phosphoshikimate 1-carboxyvinyltransferase [Bacteroidetes bacterium GWD2_45_23]|nr:MAG: 3-phosphoshikimate 1-carboxyvinyltransferase [Bacteroidetes bacterium GWC2_46_850]OFX79019.1 MAG: 3-phosphoshikimate 1-carboxyvinyltransferase [Bacteroidetes bacterium GWC1_47_7]OFX83054.1 MAG: 3-phosphoshikimate 1-carboxyvinyltransferase [Bacteroidetes bacterium GWD2_45_23]HAR38189.1 3-phosphoshikimate 1-carboxyvinyltransferase [Porphyromonadaceae bacterium]HBA99918.1 3-phosphoshikimate 1-carboxyvinyltransferase [Porphyromonadaceae bacterium]